MPLGKKTRLENLRGPRECDESTRGVFDWTRGSPPRDHGSTTSVLDAVRAKRPDLPTRMTLSDLARAHLDPVVMELVAEGRDRQLRPIEADGDDDRPGSHQSGFAHPRSHVRDGGREHAVGVTGQTRQLERRVTLVPEARQRPKDRHEVEVAAAGLTPL